MNPPNLGSSSASQIDVEHKAELRRIGDGNIALRVVIHREKITNRRPLVIINSVDFPMPPSVEFCEQMWGAGYQVIFIERPGFGSSKSLPDVLLENAHIQSGATVAAEAALLCAMLRQLALKEIVLLTMGSANPVGYRMANLHPEIELSIFSNAMFNQNIWGVFRPTWFQAMLRQTVVSWAGLKFAAYGVKHQLSKAPLAFYRQILQKSQGDLSYLERNQQDFLSASRLICKIEPATFNYDLRMSLARDERLHDAFFKGVNAIALSGRETTDLWQREMKAETSRLALPLVYAPSGDLYAPYASPQTLLSAIDEHSKCARPQRVG
ncbi:MAG: hypothetical protein AAF437_03135 [Pseudomonadota bacterium]